jgi:serine/threonine protein kinase
VVLYECLTGRLPFEARTPVSLIAKLLHDEPAPPETVNPDIPPALSALIMRLLAKSAGDRPKDAAELGELLSHLG